MLKVRPNTAKMELKLRFNRRLLATRVVATVVLPDLLDFEDLQKFVKIYY